MTLDFSGGGYRLGQQPELTPFTKREDCIPNSTTAAHFTTVPDVLPAGVRESLRKCPASSQQKQELQAVLESFSPMFTETPGKTDILLHRIETGDAPPRRCNPRPISVHKRALLDAALEEMIDTGSVLGYSSACVFRQKLIGNYGDLLVCGQEPSPSEFQRVNALPERNLCMVAATLVSKLRVRREPLQGDSPALSCRAMAWAATSLAGSEARLRTVWTVRATRLSQESTRWSGWSASLTGECLILRPVRPAVVDVAWKTVAR
ncbi:uncharacterized protein ISCGN_024050 [Ixodes scapularis]